MGDAHVQNVVTAVVAATTVIVIKHHLDDQRKAKVAKFVKNRNLRRVFEQYINTQLESSDIGLGLSKQLFDELETALPPKRNEVLSRRLQVGVFCEHLARGSKMRSIARRNGISVRSVRRVVERVANLVIEKYKAAIQPQTEEDFLQLEQGFLTNGKHFPV